MDAFLKFLRYIKWNNKTKHCIFKLRNNFIYAAFNFKNLYLKVIGLMYVFFLNCNVLPFSFDKLRI